MLLDSEILGWVEETFKGAGLFGDYITRIGCAVAVPMAQQYGKTIFQTEPAQKVAEEYRLLAREVISRLAASKLA